MMKIVMAMVVIKLALTVISDKNSNSSGKWWK